jgi:hypothetical protein
VGAHTIFVGEVISGEVISNKKCMTYEYYHQIKGGITPTTAPTYVKE